MLAEKMLHGDRDVSRGDSLLDSPSAFERNSFANNDVSSPERDAAAHELESRNVDFGSDWSDAGSSDSDSSGGSDDW